MTTNSTSTSTYGLSTPLSISQFNNSRFIESFEEIEYGKIAFKTNKCAIVQILLSFWEEYGNLMQTEHNLIHHYTHTINELCDLMDELKYMKRQKKIFCKCKNHLNIDNNDNEFHHNIVKSLYDINIWRIFFSKPHKYDLFNYK